MILALTLTSAGCATPGRDSITVLAAASLSDVGPALEQAYEQETGEKIAFSFGGSALLAAQITHGAPADAFLSASAAAVEGIQTRKSSGFASNSVVIAVQRGNPRGIQTAEDLRDHLVAACAPEVPCGAAAAPLLTRFGIVPRTLETDVKGVAGKVALGEVDAGLVYRTDVLADRRLRAIETGMDLKTGYVAASLTSRGDRLVEFMLGATAQRILRAAGFTAP
jgi:molybdate transport system substrate-binding protein